MDDAWFGRGDFRQAQSQFQHTVTLDPSYIKGYHNLAMILHVTGQDTQALNTITKARKLAPQERDSMLLGRNSGTAGWDGRGSQMRQDADFLPEGNWSERLLE